MYSPQFILKPNNMNRNELIHSLKVYIPKGLRKKLRSRFSFVDYNIYYRKSRNPFLLDAEQVTYSGSPIKVGIFKEFYQYHKSYISACRDLEISYQLIDLQSPSWQQQVQESQCDAYLAWPSAGLSVWKEMFDDKLRIMVEDMNKLIYPSLKEIWLFENKNRVQDWLRAHNIPQPQTWVFYDIEEALKFAENCRLPLIYKTRIGSSANGVKVFRDRQELKSFIRKAYSKGYLPGGHHPLDKEWGRIYLQDFIEDAQEWRMIRIGESFFGYRKEKSGDFHSGSHKWSWLDPGKDLLDFTFMVTEQGNFSSMDVDVLIDKQGKMYVNELQTVFGATTPKEMLKINGVEGRYRKINGQWVFEPGQFSANECSNLRLLNLVDQLSHKKKVENIS